MHTMRNKVGTSARCSGAPRSVALIRLPRNIRSNAQVLLNRHELSTCTLLEPYSTCF